MGFNRSLKKYILMKRFIVSIVLVLIIQTGFSQTTTTRDFHRYFDEYGVKGCFVLFNQAENMYIKYNTDLCDSGYIPASTFKIPNSIIALEEGIIKDTSQVIKWDGHEWPNKPWNRDQTLGTAMKYSCIWVYIGFADQIGIEKYQEFLNAFNYGNKNLTGPPDKFWLSGMLRISANQQVEFLRKFYNYELPRVSERSVDIVKDIIMLEQEDGYKLCGKTGGGMLNDNEYIMWLVGYIEKEHKPYFYALNFVSGDYNKTSRARLEITKAILRDLKLLD